MFQLTWSVDVHMISGCSHDKWMFTWLVSKNLFAFHKTLDKLLVNVTVQLINGLTTCNDLIIYFSLSLVIHHLLNNPSGLSIKIRQLLPWQWSHDTLLWLLTLEFSILSFLRFNSGSVVTNLFHHSIWLNYSDTIVKELWWHRIMWWLLSLGWNITWWWDEPIHWYLTTGGSGDGNIAAIHVQGI